MNDHREVVFAAWMANIGRFYEGGAIRLIEKCKKILDKYMDTAILTGILQGDERYKLAKRTVEAAFNLSLCESERKQKLAKGKNLTTVFARVTAEEGEYTEKQYYSIAEEAAENFFPSFSTDDSKVRELSKKFERELQMLEKSPADSWADFIVVFDSLCRKYMWCITASDYEGEDISLYNQSRIAGAIAKCMCECDAEHLEKNTDEPLWYKLVVCDFSGIQKYVFSVASVNERSGQKAAGSFILHRCYGLSNSPGNHFRVETNAESYFNANGREILFIAAKYRKNRTDFKKDGKGNKQQVF